ncbi:hypothetical protein [Sodalis sp.]
MILLDDFSGSVLKTKA